MQKTRPAYELFLKDFHDQAKENERRVSIIQSMSKSTKNQGTEIKTLTFTPNEDAVVPDGWDILSVDHDRQMAVTRVTVSRPYSKEQSDAEKAELAGPAATPTYPQTAGAVPTPPVDPSTSYTWGTLDTTKVQNVEDVKRVGPTIAEQEAAGKPQEEKDATEVASELNADALDESAEPAHTADNPVDKASEAEAKAASQSKASADAKSK